MRPPSGRSELMEHIRRIPRGNWVRTAEDRYMSLRLPSQRQRVIVTHGLKNVVAVLTLHVDYVVFLGAGKAVIEMFKAKLMEPFEMMDVGDVSLVLGMQITRDREKEILPISQTTHTEALSEKL